MHTHHRSRAASLVLAVIISSAVGVAVVRSSTLTAPPHLGYGLNTWDQIDLAAELGFDWIKFFEEALPPPATRLPYNVLYRVFVDGYPADVNAYQQHVRNLALAGLHTVEAYEIGNEVNLRGAGFWGDHAVNPEAYAQLLCDVYPVIKQADPGALVISAGLAPVGAWSPENWNNVMDETVYAQRMLDHMLLINNGQFCIDAFGYHPHGFKYAPETPWQDVSNGFAFRSAERMRGIMEDHGAGALSMWATEFGWIRDPNSDPWFDENGQLSNYGWCKGVNGSDLAGFLWMLVSVQEQADYLVRAFQYADEHWPWMGPMFVWNLDLYYRGWSCSHQKFYSLLYASEGNPAQRNFTPAYLALQAMPKRFANAPQLQVNPHTLTFLTAIHTPTLTTATLSIRNLSASIPLTWTIAVSATGPFTPAVWPADGVDAGTVFVQIDPGAITQTGRYTGTLNIGTVPTTTYGSPRTIPIEVVVVEQLYVIYLPVIHSTAAAPLTMPEEPARPQAPRCAPGECRGNSAGSYSAWSR